MPPYQANIPAANDQISISQGDIQGNFQAINTAFNANHVDFNGGAAVTGKHKWVTFTNQAAAPAGLASEFLMYNKIPAAPYPLTGNQELFLQRVLGASPYTVPLSMKDFTAGTSGYAYLPSGLLMKFGRGTTNGAGVLAINMDAIGQVYAAVPFVLVTPMQQPAPGNQYRWAQLVPAITSSVFTVNTGDFVGAPASGSFQWFSIGTY